MSAPFRLFVPGMTGERAGRRELTEFMSHHVLGHVHGDVLLAVVHGDGQADEIGRDRRSA